MDRKFFKRATFVAFAVQLAAVVQAAPPTDADCTSDVPFPNPESCSSFYQCFLVNSAWVLVPMDCPPGGIWNDASKSCVEGTCTDPTTITTTAPTTTTTLVTTVTPSTTTPSSTTSSGPKPIICTRPGFFPHPSDPTKYYQCILTGGRFYYYIFTCPPLACFQASNGACVIGSCPPA